MPERTPPQDPPAPPARPPLLPLNYASTGPSASVRDVGLAQRRIMWVILLAVLVAAVAIVPMIVPPPMRMALPLVLTLLAVRLGVIVVMMISVYKLGGTLGMSNGARIAFAACMIIPYVGIILLLIVNHRATKVLRSHGIYVGLMGAKLGDLPIA
jgi:hypothetical protein